MRVDDRETRRAGIARTVQPVVLQWQVAVTRHLRARRVPGRVSDVIHGVQLQEVSEQGGVQALHAGNT